MTRSLKLNVVILVCLPPLFVTRNASENSQSENLSYQVGPDNPDHRYSKSGVAIDLVGEGVDEIVTARGSMANLSNAVLMRFKEVEEEEYWEEHEIASIWPSGYTAPHDIVSMTIGNINRSRNLCRPVLINHPLYEC